MSSPPSQTAEHSGWRRLRILIAITLIVLVAQGWTGDAINLFASFPTGAVTSSLNGFFQAVYGVGAIGPVEIWHTFEGALLLLLSVAILALSWKSKPKSVRICAILGLFFMISAALGGINFVLSGFKDNGASAQMGTSFIGTFGVYFLELYYAK